ncbi:MAG: hypothetical protein ACRDZ7_13520 [Acidimicrobiia bacterium]
MTLIEERPVRPDVEVRDGDAPVGSPTVEPVVDVPEGRLSRGWVATLSVAWVTIFSLGVALEPASTGQESMPLVGTSVAMALTGCWVAMASGFVQGRRYGAVASLAAAFCLLGMTIGCPLSGHHLAIGSWWWFQLAGSVALLGLSRSALAAR